MNKISLPQTFPTLPSAVQKIQKLFAQENVTSTLLVSLLEQEPLLCANILKLVNSSYYGLSKRITSINHAVMLLGTTIIRGIIMASVLKKSFPLDLTPYQITIDEFDTICILRSRVLTLWMHEQNIDLPTLSSVAFLMESGKIIMANEIIRNNLQEHFTQLLNEHYVHEAEKIIFGTTSYELAAQLFAEWLFEESFIGILQGIISPTTQEQRVLKTLELLINTKSIMGEDAIQEALDFAQEHDMASTQLLHAIKSLQNELA